jgi:hypothetical protein
MIAPQKENAYGELTLTCASSAGTCRYGRRIALAPGEGHCVPNSCGEKGCKHPLLVSVVAYATEEEEIVADNGIIKPRVGYTISCRSDCCGYSRTEQILPGNGTRLPHYCPDCGSYLRTEVYCVEAQRHPGRIRHYKGIV